MRRIWYLAIWLSFSNTVGCIEAATYSGDRSVGYQRIEEARAEVDATGTWPAINWWTDRPDPLGGMLDFASEAWVSATRGAGDCDDAMVLAEEILSGYETARAFIESVTGLQHAVLLWHTPAGWVTITGMLAFPTVCETAYEAAYLFFGSGTADILIVY